VLTHLTAARRSRAGTVLLVVAVTLVACLGAVAVPARSSAQAEPPVTVTVSRTSDLTDGAQVQITATTRGPDVRLQATADTHATTICRPGVTYSTLDDTRHTRGNCPLNGVSSSSESRGFLYPLADGSSARGSLVVGVGTVDWSVFSEGQTVTYSLTCDQTHPCVLVTRLRVSIGGGPFTDTLVTTELSFAPDDPTVACGEPDPARLATGGSDRWRPAWLGLTLDRCRGDRSGAATTFVGAGEGDALAAFGSGGLDLAYTASGDRPVTGLDAPDRPAVYTPVALNAVVLAVIGGQVTSNDPNWPIGLPAPFTDDVRLTRQEVAVLLGQGQSAFDARFHDAVLARNPQLGNGVATYYIGSDKYTGPLALQGADPASLYVSSFLDAEAHDDWVSPPASGSVPRGVVAQLGAAQPSFTGALQPVASGSQMAAIARLYVRPNTATPGPGWALTDYATATALGLTPVAIENGAGQFVRPTPESMAAAVPSMLVDADGRRQPDPAGAAAGAYPLTMVEYAMTPAEPLVDAACVARPGSQALLASWLQYLIGPGQQALPAGFTPLTPDLQAEAAATIPRVGASPSTACGPTTPPGPAAGPAAPSVAAVAGTGASGSGAGAGRFGSGAAGPGAGLDAGVREATPDELAAASEAADATEPRLPPFLGIRAVTQVLSPVALLLIVGLTSLTALVTSGRALPAGVRLPVRRCRRG
jgi:hypothetical protein